MKIVLLGDSLFARKEGQEVPHIQVSLGKEIPALSIQNESVSGFNSYDLLELLDRTSVGGSDLVFLWIGANDMAIHKQVYLGEFQANIRRIVAKLQESYRLDQIVLMGVAPVDEEKQLYRTNRLANYYSNIIKGVALESGIAYLSVMDLFSNAPIPLEDLLTGSMDDGLHFGSTGYGLLAKKMAEVIRSVRSSKPSKNDLYSVDTGNRKRDGVQ